MGYPPLVTPLSQMVGTQAMMNVISGERYKIVPSEIRDYVHGMYGRPPVSISKEIREKIIGDDEVITCRPADLIEPQMPKLREEISQYARSEEDVLSYALFPEQARDFPTAARTRSTTSPSRRSASPSTARILAAGSYIGFLVNARPSHARAVGGRLCAAGA